MLRGGIAAYKNAGLPIVSFERIDLVRIQTSIILLCMYVHLLGYYAYACNYPSPFQRNPETSLDSLLSSGYKLLDVRTEAEFQSNTASTAANLPLATLYSQLSSLDK